MAGSYEQAKVGDTNASAGPKWVAQFLGMNEKLNPSNLLEDTGLASPNNGAYRTLIAAAGHISRENAANTWWLASGTGAEAGTASAGGSSGIFVTLGAGGGAGAVSFPPFLNLAAADLAVANKTTKLQLRAAVLTNEIKPLLTFTVGLYPVTSAGSENGVQLSLGTVVTGSTVAFTEPAIKSVTRGVTAADFSLPADGLYALGFVTSAKMTAKSAVMVLGELQVRNV